MENHEFQDNISIQIEFCFRSFGFRVEVDTQQFNSDSLKQDYWKFNWMVPESVVVCCLKFENCFDSVIANLITAIWTNHSFVPVDCSHLFVPQTKNFVSELFEFLFESMGRRLARWSRAEGDGVIVWQITYQTDLIAINWVLENVHILVWVFEAIMFGATAPNHSPTSCLKSWLRTSNVLPQISERQKVSCQVFHHEPLRENVKTAVTHEKPFTFPNVVKSTAAKKHWKRRDKHSLLPTKPSTPRRLSIKYWLLAPAFKPTLRFAVHQEKAATWLNLGSRTRLSLIELYLFMTQKFR